ncbi:MAG: hypothetical protein ACOZQL_19430 [Myxococcota bacterium]
MLPAEPLRSVCVGLLDERVLVQDYFDAFPWEPVPDADWTAEAFLQALE